MLESMKKSNVVQSIKGCGHVQSSENCNFAGINVFHDIICELEQSSLSRMKFTISRIVMEKNWEILKREEKKRERARRSRILPMVFRF